MALYHPLHNRQSKSRSIGLPPWRIEPGERSQQVFLVAVRDPVTMIADLDDRLIRLNAGFNIDFGHRAAGRLAVTARVFNEIIDHALQIRGIALDRDIAV